MKASVVIAARDAEAFIGRAISSALDQTLSDIEVVVVDDGSTDATCQIVQRFMDQDRRVRLIRHPHSLGVSAARNAALSSSQGAWIATLDADDAFHRERLSTLVAEAERRRLDALADNLTLLDRQSQNELGPAFPDSWLSSTRDISLADMLSRDSATTLKSRPFGLIKPIMRRSFLIANNLQYDEEISVGEDFLFYWRLLLAGGRLGTTSRDFYHYSITANSASNRAAAIVELIKSHVRTYEAYDQVRTDRRDRAVSGDGLDLGIDLSPALVRRGLALDRARRCTLLVQSMRDGHLCLGLLGVFCLPPAYFAHRIWLAVMRRLQARTRAHKHVA